MHHEACGILVSWPRFKHRPLASLHWKCEVSLDCQGSPWGRNFRCIVAVVQLLSCVQLFETPWTAACQASLSFTISQSLLKLMSIESVMPSNHLILYHPLLLLTSIFPRVRVFSNELALCIKCQKYWQFSFSISPSFPDSSVVKEFTCNSRDPGSIPGLGRSPEKW